MKLTFDPALIIFFMVASTLIAFNFIDDEQLRNLIGGVSLVAAFVVFFSSLLVNSLNYRVKPKL